MKATRESRLFIFFYKEGSKDCERVKNLLKEFPRQLVIYINVESDSALAAIDRYNVCMVPTVVSKPSGKKICGRNICKESLSEILL